VGLFFNLWAACAWQTHPFSRALSKRAFQFLSPTSDGLHIKTTDLGDQSVTTVTQAVGLDGGVPAALLFIQA
jgi:hypothetical protein